MSSYTNYHKKYYDSNKDEISKKIKDTKYWETYYDKNKEEVKRKALDRYYKKIGKENPHNLQVEEIIKEEENNK